MRTEKERGGTSATRTQDRKLNRRNILLGSTTLAAASALGAGAPVQVAQAQAQPAAPAGRKPNILFIMGDDIGWFNVSAYNMGIMGYRTPNIDRIGQRRRGVHRLVRPAKLHRRARRLHHRPVADPHRPDQGRPAGRGTRARAARSIRRRCHEVARLRHRPVRQEPSRRPQRASADGARLRRVLRQSLSPQRRGGAGESRLSERPEIPREVRAARRAQVQGERSRRSDGRSGLRARRQADRSRTPARSTPSAWRRSTRNFSPRRRTSSRVSSRPGAPWFCYFNSDADARLHASQEGVAGQDRPRPLSRRHGRDRRPCRRAVEAARRSRRRRQHHRRLHDRQWRRSLHLARRRHNAVQGREGDQLGRRLPRALPDPLAGRDQARHDRQRHLRARGLHPDLRGGGGRARPRREGAEGHAR